MSLNQKQLSELCELAKSAALKAGEVIHASMNSPIELEKKLGEQSLASKVLTETDLKAQAQILQVLEPSLTKYQLGLLAEETEDDGSRFEKDYFWCIDPLDGTLNFSQQKKGFSCAIALVSKVGQAILAAVYDPSAKKLYHAVHGKGAFVGEKKFEVKNQKSTLNFFSDHGHYSHETYDKQIYTLNNYASSIGRELVVHPPQGAVMNAISTIEHGPALYYKRPKQEQGGGCLWDFAASSLIHSEAGGLNAYYDHSPMNLNQESLYLNESGVIFLSSRNLLQALA